MKILGWIKIILVLIVGLYIWYFTDNLHGEQGGWTSIFILYFIVPVYLLIGVSILIWGVIDIVNFGSKSKSKIGIVNHNKEVVSKEELGDTWLKIPFEIISFITIILLGIIIVIGSMGNGISYMYYILITISVSMLLASKRYNRYSLVLILSIIQIIILWWIIIGRLLF